MPLLGITSSATPRFDSTLIFGVFLCQKHYRKAPLHEEFTAWPKPIRTSIFGRVIVDWGHSPLHEKITEPTIGSPLYRARTLRLRHCRNFQAQSHSGVWSARKNIYLRPKAPEPTANCSAGDVEASFTAFVSIPYLQPPRSLGQFFKTFVRLVEIASAAYTLRISFQVD